MKINHMIGFITGLAILTLPCQAEPTQTPVQRAQLLVTIFNPTGVPAQDAKLYIYDLRTKTFQDMPYKNEPITLHLAPGRYRLYSSFSVQMGDHIARYASPEAKIKLGRGQIETIILSLAEGEDPITQLSYSTLQKTHVAHELQQYLR